MDAMKQSGAVLLYDPAFSAQRRPRSTIQAFARMVFTYGRGRAEQFRLHPSLGSTLNFVPPLFCLYLVAGPFLGWLGWVPMGFYLIAILAQAIVSGLEHGMILGFLSVPFVALTHCGYGLGFWRGLFTSVRPRGERTQVVVQLERIAP